MPRVFYILLVSFLVTAVFMRIWLDKPQGMPKARSIAFEATVKSEPRVSDTGQVIDISDIRVYTDLYPLFLVGDRIRVEGFVDDKGRMFGAKISKIGHRESLASLRSDLRLRLAENVGSLMGRREATLVLGSVLGVDSIGDKFHEELVKTGTIHVVVVSGQNLMIVAGIFMAMAPYIGRRRSVMLSILAVFAYAFLAGFEPPVMRAGIMVLTAALASYFGRQTDVLWLVLVAALIIVFFFPRALFEISFQLTFAATLGIVTLGRHLEGVLGRLAGLTSSWLGHSLGRDQRSALSLHKAHRSQNSEGTSSRAPLPPSWFLRSLVQNAAIATSAYIFTAPIIIYYFGRISPIAPIANLLVAEAIFPVMVLGFGVCLASLFFMPLASVLAYLAFVPAYYFSTVVKFFAAMPFAQYSFGQGNLGLVVGAYIMFLALAFIWTRKTRQS